MAVFVIDGMLTCRFAAKVSVAGSLGWPDPASVVGVSRHAARPSAAMINAARRIAVSRVRMLLLPSRGALPSRAGGRQRTRTTDSCIVAGSGWPLVVTV